MNHAQLLAAHLAAETDEQYSPVIDQLRRASEENRRRDVERWRVKACDRVLEEFRLLGHQGFVCMKVDGEIVFSPVGEVPEFLREAV